MWYADVRQRASETRLAFDDVAERGALSAVLFAPREHAKRLAKRLFQDHFFIDVHGWLWGRVSYAVGPGKVDFGDGFWLRRWLTKERICETCRERFGIRLPEVVGRLDQFWWHGDYFCDRVLAAAKCRARLLRAGGDLEDAIARTEAGWTKGNWQ
jgi:hypothetical protein